jgi:PAS domain-containing protein
MSKPHLDMIDYVDSITQRRPPLGAELQVALNLIPAQTWYAVPSGALIFLNERGSDYLGLPQDHPLRFGIDTGAEWDSHIPLSHPDDHEETRRVWSTCLRTGCAGQVSFRVRDAEGGFRWFLSRAEPVRGSDGSLLYWIGINLDIEDRKQAEFYLGEGQRLAHMGSWTFNVDGFDYWSPELFRIHGLDPNRKAPTVDEYVALVHPEDRGFVAQAIQKMLADHRSFDFTKRIVRPDGEIRHVRCVGTVDDLQRQTRGVKHFIWSTLPDVGAISGDKFNVPPFTGKAKIDRVVKDGGFENYTFVIAPFYYQNLAGALAPQKQADGSMGWALPLDPTLRVIHMGDINELGNIVAGAFAHPDEAGNGQYLPLVGDFMSFDEIVETVNRQGHNYSYKQVPKESFAGSFPGATEIAEMLSYWEAHTYLGSDSSDLIALANKVAGREPTRFSTWAWESFPKQLNAIDGALH